MASGATERKARGRSPISPLLPPAVAGVMLEPARRSTIMARGDYHLVTRWELEATPQEVYDLIADAVSLPLWWPSVYLDARPVETGDERGVGRVVEVLAAGFLPLTLRWRIRINAARAPERIAVETTGDLEGLGVWAFEPGERRTVVRFHWRGRLGKPVMRQIPTFVRPVFMASHRWAMERGFTSLLLEVWRRRTSVQEARDWLPHPPGPVFPHNVRRWWRRRQTSAEADEAISAPASDAQGDAPCASSEDEAARREP